MNIEHSEKYCSLLAMPRPQTAGARAESDLKAIANKRLVQSTDPIEKLRCYCLSRGANGILGLGRYAAQFAYLKTHSISFLFAKIKDMIYMMKKDVSAE